MLFSPHLFAGDYHLQLYTNLIFPVNNADIIPALTARALDSFSSSVRISASMPLRISALV